MLSTVVVGLGQQSVEDHLPAIAESPMFNLLAVCDVDKVLSSKLAKEYKVPGYTSVKDVLVKHRPDVAVVAVPHHQYFPIMKLLITKGIHVIKEKPFAINMQEASEVHRLIQQHKVFVGVTLQRRFHPVYQAFHQLARRIGKIFLVEGHYTHNIPKLDEGWRASKQLAGGGALVDMGYHFIDLLVWYLGMPDSVTARMTLGNREGQLYDVEDTACLLFDYPMNGRYEEKLVGTILISRVYPKKDELLQVFGSHGTIIVQRGKIQRLDSNGEVTEQLERIGAWPSAAVDQIEFFGRQIEGFDPKKLPKYHEQLKHIAIVEAAYRSDATGSSIRPADILKEFGFEEALRKEQ